MPRHGSLVGIAAVLLIEAPAFAQSLDEVRRFDIPAQPMSDALIAFSQQSGLRVVAKSKDLARLRSAAIRDTVPARTALSRILGGSKLKWRSINDDVIVVEPRVADAGHKPKKTIVAPRPLPLSPPGAPAGPAAPAAAGDPPAREIVVTGSRVVTDGMRAPTPLMVVRAEQLARFAPGSIAEGLSQLPIFQGGINAQQTQLVSSNRVRSGNYLNLRNLGPQRLLVLWDGYRLPPGGNNGGVDTDIIPQMLIERVEVVTGGASAVYGSDAVSGVVNYILDKRFTGVKTLAQTGLSAYGDAHSYRLGIAGGAALMGDRLRFQASAEYYSNDGIPRRSSRPGGDELWTTGARDPTQASGTLGSAANPYLDYPNVTLTNLSRGGVVTQGPEGLVNMHFLPSGALVPYDPGTPIGRPGYAQGGDGVSNCTDCMLVPRVTTAQLFARMGYDFGSGIQGFAQVSYNRATNRGENVVLGSGDIPIHGDNYFLQQQLTAAQRALLGEAPLILRRYLIDWDTRAVRPGAIPSEQDMESITATMGLSGGLFADWKWDAAFTYGGTDLKAVTQEIRSDRLFAAIDAVAGPDGAPVCRVTLVSTRFPDCRPLNILGVGRADPAAVQWVLDDSRWRTRNHLYFGGINVTGTPFSTWAGPVSLAFGGEYRKQRISQTSNSDPAVPVDFTGIRSGNGGVFRSTNVGVADGEYSVREVYAEAVVPLARGADSDRLLELNAAFRHAAYSLSGGVDSWKVGLIWEPVGGISFRGAYSRDIRAPSLFELFAGQTLLQNPAFDPVTNMTYVVANRGGGNLDLRPEKADTVTLGMVLKPGLLPGFHGSIDYFDIGIEDAIGTPGSTFQIFVACAADPASPLCDLIKRDANNVPIEVSGIYQNLTMRSVSGIDFELGHRVALGAGHLSTRIVGTHLISYKQRNSPPTGLIEYAGTADLPGFLASTYPLPRWRANLDIAYAEGGFSVGVQQRMIGGYVKSRIQHYVDNRIGPVFYTDLNLSQKLPASGGTAELFLTAANLFNRKGPFFVTDQNPGTQIPTVRGVYDVMGRYVTIGLKTKF